MTAAERFAKPAVAALRLLKPLEITVGLADYGCMRFWLLIVGLCLDVAVAAAPTADYIPEVSARCQAENAALARACPPVGGLPSVTACRKRHRDLDSNQCWIEGRAHTVAIASACRRDRAPRRYQAMCHIFKEHPQTWTKI
jgi:hypothetical protein